MKKSSLLAALGLLAFSAASLVASPLLRYEFNETGSTQSSSGSEALSLTVLNYNNQATDYITAAPVQRPGTGSNLALNFTGTNVDAGLPSGQIPKGAAEVALNDGNAEFLRGGLGSFTVTGWMMGVAEESIAGTNLRRIFSLRHGGGSVIDLMLDAPLNATEGKLSLNLGAQNYSFNNIKLPLEDDSWYFFSVAYDASTGELNFYIGAQGDTLESNATYHTSNRTASGTVYALLNNASTLAIGNAGYSHTRRFDGYLSDIRFYDSMLTAQQIDQIYAIPEPGTAMMLGAGIFAACFFPWKLVKR